MSQCYDTHDDKGDERPDYLLAHQRPDGLIDFVLLRPSDTGRDEVLHVARRAQHEAATGWRVERLILNIAWSCDDGEAFEALVAQPMGG